jgi:3-hydroxyisobutyrate dehydrogenase-like beta-hydroxyacid dehydrogenase
MGTKHGLIGLGSMGKAMATRVVGAGLDLVVFDVRDEPMSELRELGAEVAASPRELAERCDIVGTMVVNDAQVESVLLGPDGALAGARPGTILLIHSTVHPDTCRRIAGLAAGQGVIVLDAPVSGTEHHVYAGSISVLVGGDGEALARCAPYLDAFSAVTFHMGDVGAGQLAKLINNQITIITGQAVHEALQLAAAAGVDEASMLQVCQASSSDSWTIRNWTVTRAHRATLPDLGAGLLHKDLTLGLSIAHDVGVQLPLAALTSQRVYDR